MKRNRKNKGFTLIELVVALTIFVIVITVIVSIFVTGLKGQRKVTALQNVQDNARYLLEFMAKEIRMSQINDSANITNNTLSIRRSDGNNVTYTFTNGRIQRQGADSSGPISSEEISVSGSFSKAGLGLEDKLQPIVTIVMKIEATGDKQEEKAEINVQTTICPRDIEFTWEKYN